MKNKLISGSISGTLAICTIAFSYTVTHHFLFIYFLLNYPLLPPPPSPSIRKKHTLPSFSIAITYVYDNMTPCFSLCVYNFIFFITMQHHTNDGQCQLIFIVKLHANRRKTMKQYAFVNVVR